MIYLLEAESAAIDITAGGSGEITSDGDINGRTEDAVGSDAVHNIHAGDGDVETNRVDNQRELADVGEQAMVCRVACGGVLRDHGAVVPEVGEVEIALGVALDSREKHQLVPHVVEGAGDDLQDDAVGEHHDILDTLTVVAVVIFAEMVMDVWHADDVAKDLGAGDTLEGHSRAAAQALLEEALLQDLAGGRGQIAGGLLDDIAAAVSVTDDIQVSEIKRSNEAGRNDFVAGDILGSDVIQLVVLVGAVGEVLVMDVTDRGRADRDVDMVLSQAADLGKTGRVGLGVGLSDGVVEHIVWADRDIVAEGLTMREHGHVSLAEVLLTEPGIRGVSDKLGGEFGDQDVSDRKLIVVDVMPWAQADSAKTVHGTKLQADAWFDTQVNNNTLIVRQPG